MRTCLPFLPFVLGLALGAQPSGPAWSLGLGLSATVPLDGARPSLSKDLNHHWGTGLGAFVGVRLNHRHELRAVVDYGGIRIASWHRPPSGKIPLLRLHDVWRRLCFGLEHLIHLWPVDDSGPYFLYGAGVQETWVGRSEGNLLEAAALVTSWALGAGQSGGSEYNTRATALDAWNPYVSAGVGWRLPRVVHVELKYHHGRYERDRLRGLATEGLTRSEWGSVNLVTLSVGFRSGI